MRAALQRAWLHKGLLARLLLPASLLYAGLAKLHRALHAAGLLGQAKLPVPLIVVGNVVAGGAGKTPVLMAVVSHLKARGIEAGVISRGYGRRDAGTRTLEVLQASDPLDAGDEPLLIRQRCEVPVFVAPTRLQAGMALLAAHPQVQVIVSDDGLQHHALARDVEICVFDERGTGNGWQLPAGPLREPWPRHADIVLRPPGLASRIEGHDVRRRLAPYAVRADGTRKPLAAFEGGVHAIAGIANPDAFFGMLQDAGLGLSRRTALPDHHDFAGLEASPGELLVCTEKDAVKLWRLRPDAWAVPLEIEAAPGFWRELDRRVDAKLSSSHGPQAARTARLPGDQGPAGL